MSTHLRRLLPAVALAATVFASAGTVPTAQARNDPTPEIAKPTLGERAAKVALTAVGVPYRWGGASPAQGFDCSGLVYWAYRRLGVELPHSSYALYEQGRQVAAYDRGRDGTMLQAALNGSRTGAEHPARPVAGRQRLITVGQMVVRLPDGRAHDRGFSSARCSG